MKKIFKRSFFMQQSRFMAIMNDYDRTLQLVRTSTNSAGEANAQYSIYTDSLEAAQNRYKNSLEAFNVALASSDLIRGYYEAMQGILDVATAAGPILTGLSVALTVLTIKHIAASVAASKEAMALALINKEENAQLLGIPKLIKWITSKIFARQLESAAVVGLANAEARAAQAALYLNTTTGGLLIVIGALVAGIMWAVGSYSSYTEKLVQSTQATIDQSKASKQEADNLNSLIKRYDELNNRINLTTAEREELKSIKDEIAKVAPNLIESIDAEGNVRLKGIDAIKEELKAKRELAMYNAKEALAAEAAIAKKTTWSDQAALTEAQKAQLKVAQKAEKDFIDTSSNFIQIIADSSEKTSETIIQEQNAIFDNLEKGLITTTEATDQLNSLTTNSLEAGIQNYFNTIKNQTAEGGADVVSSFDEAVKKIENLTGQPIKQTTYDNLRNQIITEGKSVSTAFNEYVESFGGEEEVIDISKNNFEKSMGNAISQMSRFTIQKFNDEKLKTAGLINDLIIGIFEMDKSKLPKGKEYTTEFEAIVSNIGKSATDALQTIMDNPNLSTNAPDIFAEADIDKNGILNIEEKMDYIKQAAQAKSEEIYNELMKKDPQKVAAVSRELANLIDENKSQTEIDKKIAEIKTTYGDDIGELIVSTQYDEKAADEAAIKLANFLLPTGRTEEQLNLKKNELKILSGGLRDFISGLFDMGEIDLGKEVYNKLLNDETARKTIEAAYAGLDTESPSSVEAFKQTLIDTLSISKDEANAMFINVFQSLDMFLFKTKETYDKLKKYQDEWKKSVSGSLTESEAMTMMQEGQYGPGGVEYTAGNFFLTGEAIESKRRQAVADLAKQHLDTLSIIDRDINAILQSTDGISQEEQQQIALLEKQREITSKILDDVTKIDIVEQGMIDNQAVMTSVSAVNSLGESLKSFGDIYNKITSGEDMSLFDTLSAIGQDPALIGALDIINGKLQFSKKALEEVALAKKNETIAFLKTEKAKTDALIAAVDVELGGIDNRSTEQKKLANQTLLEMGGKVNATLETQDLVNGAILSEVQAQNEVAKAEHERHAQYMKNKADEIEAIKQKATIEGATIVVPELPIVEPFVPIVASQVENQLEKVVPDLGQILSDRYGVTFEDTQKQWQMFKDKLMQESQKQGSIISGLENMSVSTLYEQVASGSSKAKDSQDKLNDSLEKFYNLNILIKESEDELQAIQSKIDLKRTGGAEDLKLLEQKAQKTADLIGLNKELNKQRQIELQNLQSQINAYNGFVYLQGESMIIAQEQLSDMLLNKKITQEYYDSVVKFAEGYNDLASSIRDTESAILDLQKQQEEMYDEIINKAIDTRQQLYDALVEADERELEEIQEKFDKMTEMENEYLNAVKNAIEQERKAREDAQKEEDIIAKKRRLATLQRDTSGLYATEAAKLQKEIADQEMEQRDAQVDSQLEALENQIKVQQEQRDLQMQMIEEQQRARKETGYYWDRVDNAIQNGPKAMVDLLTSTQEYQTADPLVQTQQLEQFNYATEQLSALIAGDGNKNVIEAIMSAARAIIENNIEEAKKAAEEATKAKTSTTTTVSATVNTPSKESTSPGATPSTTGSDSIKALQSFLNTYFNAGLKVDGLTGPKTKAATDSMLNKMIPKARDYYGANSGYFLSTQGALLDSINNDKINSTAYSFIKKMFPGAHASMNGLKYKKGGVVDYTGPAWVDGTTGDPEAFLNAKQTEIFAQMRDDLEQSRSFALKTGQAGSSASTSIGDIIINLQNPINASAEAVAALVKKDILNSIQNRVSMTIQNVR